MTLHSLHPPHICGDFHVLYFWEAPEQPHKNDIFRIMLSAKQFPTYAFLCLKISEIIIEYIWVLGITLRFKRNALFFSFQMLKYSSKETGYERMVNLMEYLSNLIFKIINFSALQVWDTQVFLWWNKYVRIIKQSFLICSVIAPSTNLVGLTDFFSLSLFIHWCTPSV